MNDKKKNDPKKLQIKITRARVNFLFITILSALNIFTLSIGGKFYIPFSSTLTTNTVMKFKNMTQETGHIAYNIIGIVISALIVGLYVLVYFKSKNNPRWMLAGLIMLSVDTLLLVIINILLSITGNGFAWDEFQIIDIALHFILLYYLVAATKASTDLERLKTTTASEQEHQTAKNDEPKEEPTEEKDFDFEYDDEPEPEPESESAETVGNQDRQQEQEEDLTKPIGKYEPDGQEPLLKGEYKKLSVFAVSSKGVSELVINGYICDRLNTKGLSCYKLCAIVNDINFTFEYTKVPHREAMFLYAGKELLDSRVTDI